MIDRLIIGEDQRKLDNIQSIILWVRRVQLVIGSAILLFMIIRILIKRLYVYNTTKMFMWCCIFYFLGMVIVLPYTDNMAAGQKYVYEKYSQQEKHKTIWYVLEKMGPSNRFWCGLIGFFNLYFYDVGYFFAVLVSYNVYCVIKGNYRKFMKNVLYKKKVQILLVVMLILHLLPFIFVFTSEFNEEGYFYSYGPTGFGWQQPQDSQQANLLLYCSITINPSQHASIFISVLNMYFCPIVMLIAHSIILYKNRAKIRLIDQEQYLNSKQQFIIISGKISIIVFFIQAFNFAKLLFALVITLIPLNINTNYILCLIIMVINFIFDLYPLLLLYFYIRYTKQKRGLQHGSSTILEESMPDD